MKFTVLSCLFVHLCLSAETRQFLHVHSKSQVFLILQITNVCYLTCVFVSSEWVLQRIRERGCLPPDASQRSPGPQCLLHALLLLAARHCCLLPVTWGKHTFPYLSSHSWAPLTELLKQASGSCLDSQLVQLRIRSIFIKPAVVEVDCGRVWLYGDIFSACQCKEASFSQRWEKDTMEAEKRIK